MPAPLDLEVVIVSHGAEALLRRCLRSLREHPASGAMRVTVVDSGSPDSTPDMVEREFPAVRLLRRENIGFSAANNVVLREDEARAVLLLNPDTEVYAGTLDAALAAAALRRADRHGRLQARHRVGRAGPRLQALLPHPAQRPRPLHRRSAVATTPVSR